jgi:membrane-associated phospholipid phosphatase
LLRRNRRSSGTAAELDRRLLRLMRTSAHSPGAERAVAGYARAGEYGAGWVALALGFAALDRERRDRWLSVAALVPVALGVNYGVKLAVRRARPRLRGLPPIGHAPATFSFPSAHATTSFAAASAAGAVRPELRGALLLAATAMALTRPYLGLHYPSDVVAGAVLGTSLGTAFSRWR